MWFSTEEILDGTIAKLKRLRNGQDSEICESDGSQSENWSILRRFREILSEAEDKASESQMGMGRA